MEQQLYKTKTNADQINKWMVILRTESVDTFPDKEPVTPPTWTFPVCLFAPEAERKKTKPSSLRRRVLSLSLCSSNQRRAAAFSSSDVEGKRVRNWNEPLARAPPVVRLPGAENAGLARCTYTRLGLWLAVSRRRGFRSVAAWLTLSYRGLLTLHRLCVFNLYWFVVFISFPVCCKQKTMVCRCCHRTWYESDTFQLAFD